MMLLIDIGNTSIVCALYNENTYLKIIRIEKIINVESKLNSFLKYKIQSIAICSVSPNKTDIFIEKINKIFKMNPFIVSHQN